MELEGLSLAGFFFSMKSLEKNDALDLSEKSKFHMKLVHSDRILRYRIIWKVCIAVVLKMRI